MTVVSVALEVLGERPLTVNQVAKMDRHSWANHTRRTREAWGWVAKADRTAGMNRVTIDVVPLHRNGSSPQDPGACAPEAKAAIDGLVDAGVLLDDNGAHVAAITFLPPVTDRGVDGLRLILTEVPR